MTVPTLETHDVLLADSTTTIGLNIVRDKNGNILLTRKPLPVLSDQQFQTLGEQAFIPQLEQPFTQAEWHAGFGKQLYTAKRYLKSTGADASYKGMVLPGPVPVACTNSNPTQTGYNMGFETSTLGFLANWGYTYDTVGNPTYSLPGSAQAGSQCVDGGSASRESTLLWQTLPVTANNNTTFQLTFWGKRTSTTGIHAIDVRLVDTDDLALGPTGFTITAAANSWEQFTFNYTFTATKTCPRLRMSLSHLVVDGGVIEVKLDSLVITWGGTALTTLTMGTIVKMLEFNGTHFAVSDTGVWKRSAANWTWVGGPPGITDAFVSAHTDTLMVLMRGASLSYWLMKTDESFVVTSGSGNSAKTTLGVMFNGADYMTRNPNLVYKVNDLYQATTTTTYTAQDMGHNFTSALVGVSSGVEAPFFIREGSAFYINASGTIIYIAQELKSLDNANTGKNSISWQGNGAQTLYMPAGAGRSLMTYDDGDVDNVFSDAFTERLSDFTGQIVAITSDDQWLYIIMDNSAKIEILKGRYQSIDDATDFLWHPFVEDTYATVGYAFVSSITAKRLYYGGGTALPKYIPLPVAYGDPLTDTALSFLTGATFETSWLDMGLKNVLKNFRSVLLRSTGLSTGHRTIKIEYDIDDGNGYVELGGVGNGSFATSSMQEKFSADGIEARYIKFRVTFTTDDSTVGLALLSLTVNYLLNPPSLEMWEFPVRIDKNSKLINTENPDIEQPYAVVGAKLWAWKNTIPLTFTFPDGLFTSSGFHDGATKKVRIAPTGLTERPITFARNLPERVDQEAEFHITLWEVRTS